MNITLGSPILQVALFVPEYVWTKESKETGEDNSLENNMEDIEGKKRVYFLPACS